MKEFKNILIVSGSGRNCGKTTTACNIIEQLKKKGPVYGLKITPHFHSTGNKQQVIAKGDGYVIFRETDSHSVKDSSRMLRAGAEEVYLVQCEDGGLPGIYKQLKRLIPKNYPVVCESGSFATVYQPGLHVLINSHDPDESKLSYKSNLNKADYIITPEEFSQTPVSYHIEYSGTRWTINKNDLV